MADNHPEHNAVCQGDEHTKHLCYFVSYGYHVDNPQDYKDLVEEPRTPVHCVLRNPGQWQRAESIPQSLQAS